MTLLRAIALLVAGALVGCAQAVKRSDRETVVAHSFAAPRQKVFDALTRQDQLPR